MDDPSTNQILTTHVGSRLRPDDLIQIMFAKEEDPGDLNVPEIGCRRSR